MHGLGLSWSRVCKPYNVVDRSRAPRSTKNSEPSLDQVNDVRNEVCSAFFFRSILSISFR